MMIDQQMQYQVMIVKEKELEYRAFRIAFISIGIVLSTLIVSIASCVAHRDCLAPGLNQLSEMQSMESHRFQRMWDDTKSSEDRAALVKYQEIFLKSQLLQFQASIGHNQNENEIDLPIPTTNGIEIDKSKKDRK